ncbi:MAG: hypothetical protein ACFB50_11480 [Rubrobacteraceae bacterium]
MNKEPTYADILRWSLRKRGRRRLALAAGLLYFVFYLYAVRHLAIGGVASPGDGPSFAVIPNWFSKLLDPIAGYTFEPVAALYLFDGFALFLAPMNLLIGLVLGGLIALNVATAAYALATVRSCRRLSWTGLLGSLPALLTGFACCVPTVGLVLGANLALTLISLQNFLLPLGIVGLTAGLFWNVYRTRKELLRVSVQPLSGQATV